METYLATEGGGVTTKVTEKYVTNKTNFKKLWYEGIIDVDLLKYVPVKQKPRQMDFEKYINVVLFNKFD